MALWVRECGFPPEIWRLNYATTPFWIINWPFLSLLTERAVFLRVMKGEAQMALPTFIDPFPKLN